MYRNSTGFIIMFRDPFYKGCVNNVTMVQYINAFRNICQCKLLMINDNFEIVKKQIDLIIDDQ